MNVSYRWLRSLAPGLDDPPARIAERLAMYGAPVDEIVDIGAPLADVLVARVVEARRHPNADRLSLCSVDAGGSELLSVVCGAPNVKPGAFYPFAPVGATLPGGIAIGRRRIRGEESQGMLCSARELGLGRDHEGILELHGTFEPGARFIDAVELNDTRLVVDVTPNRPDLLSHYGIARELAPGGAASLTLPSFANGDGAPVIEFVEATGSASTDDVTVRIEDRAGCPRYIAVVIRGVTVIPSPEWLASRLRTIGLRPINNVVDATNYVLHELGQPLHAFDFDRLGNTVVVRRARQGESLVTLDGVERRLDENVLVIADANRPVALAGIMGGQDTEVTDATRAVLLECALFDPRTVRAGRRALGLSTDASYRFERGVDPDLQERAARRCAELIVAVAGGTVSARAPNVGEARAPRPVIRLRSTRIEQVLGVRLEPESARGYLEGIGFRVAEGSNGALHVEVPGHRVYDVAREDDLIEEIARRHGYDAFPDELRPFRPSVVPTDAMAQLEDRLRTLLVARGFLEARSAPLGPQSEGDVALMHPLSSTESHLRRAILPGLLRRVEANFNRGARDVRLFEIGTVFLPGRESVPEERNALAAAFTGARTPPHWTGGIEPYDEWDVKGLLEELADVFGATVAPAEEAVALLEPDATWSVGGGGGSIGFGGRIRAGVIDAPEWAESIFGLEVTIEAAAAAPRLTTFTPLPSFPAVERDLALVVPKALAAARVEDVIRGAAGPLLESVSIFDVYEGVGIAPDARSIAFRLRFRSGERTLTDDEVDAIIDRILERLRDEHDIRRR